MGLISAILTAPYAPVRVVLWVGELLQQQVQHELYDPKVIRRQLEELEEAGAAGRIPPEEKARREEVLLGRLLPASSTSATTAGTHK